MGYLKVLVVAVACHCLLMIHADQYEDEQWEAYKTKYNKTYDSPKEEEEAKSNFQKNQHDHYMHNLNDSHDYDKEVHEHSDKKPEEAIQMLCATEVPEEEKNRTRRNLFKSERGGDRCIDWVKEGKVSSVKNQGSCGSCWAFTAVGAVEGAAARKWSGGPWSLSPQELVDCSTENSGCNGGWPDTAFRYMMKHGHVMDSCYPYTGSKDTCRDSEKAVQDCYQFRVTGYQDVAEDDASVADALVDHGPLAIAIYVNNDFMSYKSGVFSCADCTNKRVNHGVVLVGCGVDDVTGKKYWKIKNSWGPNWGENGYIRILRDDTNQCMVRSYASYPTL